MTGQTGRKMRGGGRNERRGGLAARCARVVRAPVLLFLALGICAEACRHRQAGRAAPGGPSVESDRSVPGLGIVMIRVPAQDLWMAMHETTNAQYRAFRPEHPGCADADLSLFRMTAEERRRSLLSLNADENPVVCIAYSDAVAFTSWLTEREKALGRLPPGGQWVYRLPTGSEWEAVAGASGRMTFPWGNPRSIPANWNYYGRESFEHSYGYERIEDHEDPFPVTAPVSRSGVCPGGILGLGGNVWELTADAIPSQGLVLARGGGWTTDHMRHMTCRHVMGLGAEGVRLPDVGFRVVLAAPLPKQGPR